MAVPSYLPVAGQPSSQAIARPDASSLRVCPSAGRGEGPGAYVDWADSKGLNEWERTALELAGERSKLG
jgi:hypothetical protein